MPFNTLTFAVFFSMVLLLHRMLPSWASQKRLLLGASYLFYSAWNPPFVALLLLSTVVDWQLARRIHRAEPLGLRRALLLLSVATNLGLLGTFKYGEFLLQSFIDAMALLGVIYAAPALDLVLPVGISFYTFQSMSYTIDVYRRRIAPADSFSDFALFVSFFPQLVAGPIVRAREFLPQLRSPRRAGAVKLQWGLVLMALGLFQKVALGDGVFAPLVDRLYLDPGAASAADAWLGIAAFSGQIYCDFAGYSTSAIGAALCLGFALPENFHRPYAACGFSDFWRRWHMSLSQWLRDYLYVSLGGNRHGTARTCVNLMLTMLIGGLWHGASWMFVLWGAMHGLYLVLERWLRQWVGPSTRILPPALLAGLTFLVITLTWIPFRAPDLGTMAAVLAALTRVHQASIFDPHTALIGAACVLGLFAWQWSQRERRLEQWFENLTPSTQGALVGGVLMGLFLFSGGDQRAFIYFQF